MNRISRNVTLTPNGARGKGPMPGFGAFAPLRLTAGLLLATLVACRGDEPEAYGNFEATEVTVAAEVGHEYGMAGLLEHWGKRGVIFATSLPHVEQNDRHRVFTLGAGVVGGGQLYAISGE